MSHDFIFESGSGCEGVLKAKLVLGVMFLSGRFVCLMLGLFQLIPITKSSCVILSLTRGT